MSILRLSFGGLLWKPDEETTKDDLKEGYMLDSEHKCKDCVDLLLETEPFKEWFKDFWKYHRRL